MLRSSSGTLCCTAVIWSPRPSWPSRAFGQEKWINGDMRKMDITFFKRNIHNISSALKLLNKVCIHTIGLSVFFTLTLVQTSHWKEVQSAVSCQYVTQAIVSTIDGISLYFGDLSRMPQDDTKVKWSSNVSRKNDEMIHLSWCNFLYGMEELNLIWVVC